MTPHEGSAPTVEDRPGRPAPAPDRTEGDFVPTPARGFVLVVLAALCWGTSGITGDLVADRTDLDPLDVAWHRMAVGAVVLVAHRALRALGLTRPARRASDGIIEGEYRIVERRPSDRARG